LDSKHAIRPNLKKYIAIDGRWRFVPVLKVNGKPRPDTVLIGGEAGKGISGTFCLEWRDDGKRMPGTLTASPASVVAGATGPATITLIGSNFVPTSVVNVGGKSRSATFVNTGQMTFQLTVAD
jgi:hypothetical protein